MWDRTKIFGGRAESNVSGENGSGHSLFVVLSVFHCHFNLLPE